MLASLLWMTFKIFFFGGLALAALVVSFSMLGWWALLVWPLIAFGLLHNNIIPAKYR